MKKRIPSLFGILRSTARQGADISSKRTGFTLIEVILVLVVIIIISGIALPYYAGSYRNNKLLTSARTISKMTRFARSMAIMRDETLTVVLDGETMEIYAGGPLQPAANAADGELDQEVLKRLGYVEGESWNADSVGVEKEVHRRLPDTLMIKEFRTDRIDDNTGSDDLCIVHFYPNGQCDWFLLELEDQRGQGIKLEIDPVSGRIRSEFTQ